MRKIGDKIYYSLKEVSKQLDISYESLRSNYIKNGKIQAVKFKREWHISQDAINEYSKTNLLEY